MALQKIRRHCDIFNDIAKVNFCYGATFACFLIFTFFRSEIKKKEEGVTLLSHLHVYYGNTGCQVGVTKLERFLPKNQHTQRKLLNFENLCNGKVSKSAKI